MQEKFRRRRLPHWDVPSAIYFVTACLDGSIPAEGLLDIVQFREGLANRRKPADVSEQEWRTLCWKWTFARQDDWLDRSHGIRHLADLVLARLVADSFYYFAGKRYDLLAYVVMPSHVHWVFRPRDEWAKALPADRSPRQQIMHSFKLHTAIECNRHLYERGTFWQDESYDHCVADIDELERIIHYIELNPVKAGLVKSREDWNSLPRAIGIYLEPDLAAHWCGHDL